MNAPTVPKRAPKRSRVFLAAEVDAGAGSAEARIRDISSTGALLESEIEPRLGDTVRVNCGETSMPARVAWVHGGWFGVEFEEPLPMSRIADSAGSQLQVSAPRSYKAGGPLD